MKKATILIFIFYCRVAAAQGIGSDSKGKDIFVFFQGSGFKPSINSSSLKVPLSLPYGVTRYYLNHTYTPANETVVDEYSFNFSVSVTNITSNLWNVFSSLNQPSINTSIGWSINNIDEFSNWNNLYHHHGILREREYTLNIKAYWNAPLSNYYDTSIKQRYPNGLQTMWQLSSVGGNVSGSLFYVRWFSIAGLLSDEYGVFLDNLKNFQNTSSIVYNNPPAISLGNAVGKLGGNIDHKSWNTRACLSAPVFVKSAFSRVGNIGSFNSDFFSRICLIPYYAPYGSHGTRWTQVVGCFAEILKSGYGGLRSNINSGFGLGLDWQTDSHARFGAPNVFFSGTFDLSKPATPTRLGVTN